MIIVRFADDIVVGFEAKADAVRFWAELIGECESSAWNCIPRKRDCWSSAARPKTGRSAETGNRRRSTFSAYAHLREERSNGRFTVLRQTIRERLQAKLGEVKTELQRRMHDPIPEVGRWLRSVVGGHIVTTACLPTARRCTRFGSK